MYLLLKHIISLKTHTHTHKMKKKDNSMDLGLPGPHHGARPREVGELMMARPIPGTAKLQLKALFKLRPFTLTYGHEL